MVGERRVVTILFCDVKGSSAAAEHLDPEDWAEIMNGAFEHMIRPVYTYEGTVARLMGDAVLAFFGAPIAHEDDPQRAILAGLKIVEGFQSYKKQVLQQRALDFDVRVGINTGLVMVGAIGSDLQVEYTAMGDAINLASRMEQTAKPGTIQVAENTYQQVAQVFDWEDLGEIEVKGKTGTVHTYRPLRQKARSGRLRGIRGLDSPLVGRQAEFETLLEAASRLEKGIGGILLILGEAGLGKSRLVDELRRQLLSGSLFQIDWTETASLSYETSQPYALFQRLLRRRWDLPPNATAESVRARISQQFLECPAEERSRYQEIFETLTAVGEGGGYPLEGETFKREFFSAMNTLLVTTRPSVIVFDDLHWADPASIELLEALFEGTERAPLLLICAMRPDRNYPGWEVKEAAGRNYPHRYTEISLQPLTGEDTNALVDNLLTTADLPSDLRKRILTKTDGNPFFVEEVVRTLIDRGAIVREVSGEESRWRAAVNVDEIEIPGNLQSLLMARIDRLEEDARRTLQLASVIGRSFYFRVLEATNQAMVAVHSELNQQLLALQRLELIQEAARVPELEYVFRHSLTQEAAYNTILLRQRREFHRRVGEAMETLFPDRLEEFYPMLAYHFAEAEDPRVVEYAILSGDAAFRLYAIPEALEHYSRALANADPRTESTERLAHLYLRRGRCLELQSDYARALENYAEMIQLARKREDQGILLAAFQAQATAYAIPGPAQDTEKGEALAQDALVLARNLGDKQAEATILWIFLLLKMYSGFMLEGIPYGEQSAALARELGLREQLARPLQDLGLAYLSSGLLAKADEVLAEARSILEATRNLPMQAENLANAALIRGMTADFKGAIDYFEESYRIAQSIDNAWGLVNARTFSGMIYLALGEVDRTIQTVQSMIVDAEKVGHPADILGHFYLSWLYNHLGARDPKVKATQTGYEASMKFAPFQALSQAMMARQRVEEGAWEEARMLLEEAGRPWARQILLLIDMVVDHVTVEYHLARRDFPQAEVTVNQFLGKILSSGARYFLPDALYLKALLLRAKGLVKESTAVLAEAQAAAEAIGSRIILWQILARSGEVEAAREEVASLAEKVSDAALRETFITYAKSIIEGEEH
jgi:class 3 adenylate cyclase/tetratricopeptide (TPR) repeat protein